MIGTRFGYWNRLGLACVLALPLAPDVRSAAQMRADDAPWHFAAWKPLVDQPVFTGTGRDTWDRKIRERGYILVDDAGIYHLWYTGYAGERPATMSLGHATSRDGLHWERDPANPIYSGSWVEDMCVVRREGTYYMFAEGKNDIAHFLTSTDGRKWTEHGPLDIRKTDGTPISPGPYGTPTAWFENGTWFLFYERGDRGIWLATSKDLKKWTNAQDNPVLASGPESYDQAAVAANQIVKRDGHYYVFYHANSQRPWKDWTTCVARSRDLIHWEKYAGNPVIENNCSSAILVRTPQGEDRLYTMHPDVKVFVARKERALATPQR
jgi:beta-1,2-mannobiose phosphorylase / 1,2-beta-oligomannan phosphorylase